MSDAASTLHPEYRSEEPYFWLSGDPSYRLPDAWREQMEAGGVGEIASLQCQGSIDEPGLQASSAYFAGPFSNPEYGVLTLAEREFIGVVVSSINCCVTCLSIHEHKLGQLIGNPGRARRIAINYRTVDLLPQERAIADYCAKLTRTPNILEAADLQALRDVGISDRKIYFIVEMAALFNLTNRLTAGYGMRPDDSFMERIAPQA